MPRKRKENGHFKGTTHVVLVWDESGSMAGLREEGVSSYNTQLEDLQKYEGKVNFTFVKFGTHLRDNYTIVHDSRPVKDVDEMDTSGYSPNGSTPLYDAMGASIRAIEKAVKEDDRALVITFTDGHENASAEWDEDKLGKTIKELQDKGNWTFAFAAAGINAWDAAQHLNIPKANTFTVAHSAAGMAAHTHTTSGSTFDYLRSAGQSSSHFYAPQAVAAVPEKPVKPAKKDKPTITLTSLDK